MAQGTKYRAGEPIAEFVARMRAEHGLPPKITDPAILYPIAVDLARLRAGLPLEEWSDRHVFNLPDAAAAGVNGDRQE